MPSIGKCRKLAIAPEMDATRMKNPGKRSGLPPSLSEVPVTARTSGGGSCSQAAEEAAFGFEPERHDSNCFASSRTLRFMARTERTASGRTLKITLELDGESRQ